jgi:hypothetical protein
LAKAEGRAHDKSGLLEVKSSIRIAHLVGVSLAYADGLAVPE